MWMTNRCQFLLSTGVAAFWVQLHAHAHAHAGAVPVRAGANVLRVTWGHDVNRHYRFSAAGRVFADERRDGERVDGFVSVDYPLREQVDDGALRTHVRMVQETGVIYGLRTLRARMPLTSHNQR